MDKDGVIDLAEYIAQVSLDADTIDIYFMDVLEEIGRRFGTPLLDIELFEITNGTATYSMPADAVSIQALFHNDRMLSQGDLKDLEAYDDEWRTLSGDPWAYVLDERTARSFDLVPTPDADSDDFSFPNGAPFGEDFPINAGTIIYSERRTTDLPDWIGVYIAFKILEREFARPSDHQDLKFSQACAEFAEILWKFGGLK